MKNKGSISIQIFNLVFQALGISEQETVEICKSADISPDLLKQADARLNADERNKLWCTISEKTRRDDIGLNAGKNFVITQATIVAYVMMNSKSVITALQKYSQYQKIICSISQTKIAEKNDITSITIEFSGKWFAEYRFPLELEMTILKRSIDELSGKVISPAAVYFSYDKPKNTDLYIEVFSSSNILFNQKNNSIIYRTKDLLEPVINSNPELFTLFENHARKELNTQLQDGYYSQKVHNLLVKYLNAEVPKIEIIAAELAMSVRNLQIRLKEEGSSYQNILDNVRKNLAISYLTEKQINKSEIAYLLGFSELSVFSRSFKKWTGQTPSQYLQN